MRASSMLLVLATSLLTVPAPVTLAAQSDASPVSATAADTELDRQTRAVASQLRCVVCQGVSIQDSPSTLAQEMRAVVREQLAAGRTPEQVRQYFVANYGEWVLLEPEPSGFNLLVYVLPVLMLLGGAAFVFRTARGMTRNAAPQPEPDDHEEALL